MAHLFRLRARHVLHVCLMIISLVIIGGCGADAMELGEEKVQSISIYSNTDLVSTAKPTKTLMDQVNDLVRSSKACNKCPFETQRIFLESMDAVVVIKLAEQVSWTGDEMTGDTLLLVPSKDNIAFGTEDKLLEYEADSEQMAAAMELINSIKQTVK